MKVRIISFLRDKLFFIMGLSVVIVYLFPYLLFNQNIPVRIHDNLDSTIALYRVLAENGDLFGQDPIPNIMSDLPRFVYPSEFHIPILLFLIFQPFTAYIINIFMIHIIAYFGMYYLLKKHFIPSNDHEFITIGIAICFAILPFYPVGGLTSAGQPLALLSFLNIRKRADKRLDWIILILIPFYSYFVLGFIFFLILIGLLWLIDINRERKKDNLRSVIRNKDNFRLLVPILMMTLLYLLIDYRLMYNMFLSNNFETSRTEFYSAGLGFKGIIDLIIYTFQYGHIHALTMQLYFSWLVLLAFIVHIKLKKSKEGYLLRKISIIIVLISIWEGLLHSSFYMSNRGSIKILNIMQWDRFYFILPLLWYIVFGISLVVIFKLMSKINTNIRFTKIVIGFIIVMQIFYLFSGSNINFTYYNSDDSNLTYEEFYAEDLFNEIKNDINLEQSDYRVVSIGMHPSIAIYNGFYTLDGYMTNYPLEYKHEFRKIIEKELEKDEKLKNYFDNWGSRCYIFVSELGLKYEYTKDKNVSISNLELNTTKLFEMGGRYVFSAVNIINADANNLELIHIYDNPNSVWRIHLYQVNS